MNTATTMVRILFVALACGAIGPRVGLGQQRSAASILAEKIRSANAKTSPVSSLQRAFDNAIQPIRARTVRIYSRNRRACLGLIVDSRGLVVTKYSELEGPLRCLFQDGHETTAMVVEFRRSLDLALLQVSLPDTTPIESTQAATEPSVGSWVLSPGMGDHASGVGVISNIPRRVRGGVLGVTLISSPRGPIVQQVMIATKPDQLHRGDVIDSIGRQKVATVAEVLQRIAPILPGEQVNLRVSRDDELQLVKVDLHRAIEMIPGGEKVHLSMSGPLSSRRSGFERVLVHDTVVLPEDCGGPLLNAHGRLIGINIARASRTSTFALPRELVEKAIDEMRQAWESSSSPPGSVSTPASR